jgi:hypothetical protein
MAFTPNFEVFANDARDAVNTAMNDSITSVVVKDATTFPTTGNFRIRIGTEIMQVTIVTGATFTIIRGIEGTTPAAHSVDDVVAGILTAGGLEQMAKDYIPLWKNTPQLGSLTDDAGLNLTASDFTWVNQGSAVITDINQGIKVNTDRTTGLSVRLLVKTAPSTPYTIIAACGHSNTAPRGSLDLPWIGIGFRESSSGKLSVIRASGNSVGVTNLTSPTVSSASKFSANYYTKQIDRYYLKVTDNGTDITYFISNNGFEWLQLFTELRGAFFTTAPDQVGFFTLGRWPTALGSTTDHDSLLLHWSET